MAKVLIVDDAAFMRGNLQKIVKGVQHDVVGRAKDGGEAAQLFRDHNKDVVLLGILIDGIDGLSVLESIMKEDPAAKVIMVSALAQQEKREEARNLGASGST